MKLVIISFCLLISTLPAICQVVRTSDDILPLWRKGELPKINTSKFYLKEVIGEGATLTDAKDKAVLSLVAEIARRKGVSITGEDVTQIASETNGGSYKEKESFTSTYKIHTDEFETSFEIVDSYWEELHTTSGYTYRCWVLFEIALEPSVGKFDCIQFSDNYGATPVLQSSLLPGWGQMSKRQNIKGGAIFIGEVGLLGVGLISENARIDNITRLNNTRDVFYKKQYLYYASNWENTRNVTFAIAGALYLYNLIDAAVSKGGKRYVYCNNINVIPKISSRDVGLALVYRLK